MKEEAEVRPYKGGDLIRFAPDDLRIDPNLATFTPKKPIENYPQVLPFIIKGGLGRGVKPISGRLFFSPIDNFHHALTDTVGIYQVLREKWHFPDANTHSFYKQVVSPFGPFSIQYEVNPKGQVYPNYDTLPLQPGIELDRVSEGLSEQLEVLLWINNELYTGENNWEGDETPHTTPDMYIFNWLNKKGKRTLICLPTNYAAIIPSILLQVTRIE